MGTMPGGRDDVRQRVLGLTQGRFVANSIAQKIPGAHSGQLRKTFHEPLRLCPFSDARCTDENNASSAFELPSGHPESICRYAERKRPSALRWGIRA